MDAGPGGRVVEGRAEVVARRVLGEPEEARAREAVPRQPLAHRDPVERGPLGVVGGAAAGKGEGAPPLRVAQGGEAEHLALEARELLAVLARGARARVEPLVPEAAEEEPLLRLGAEHLLGPLGLAVGRAARQGAHLREERLEGRVRVERDGDVVRAPGEGRDGVPARAGVPARVVLELVDAEVREAGAGAASRRTRGRRCPAPRIATPTLSRRAAGRGRSSPVRIRCPRRTSAPTIDAAERGAVRGLAAGGEEGREGRQADERGDGLAAGGPHVTRTSATRSRRSSRGPGR